MGGIKIKFSRRSLIRMVLTFLIIFALTIIAPAPQVNAKDQVVSTFKGTPEEIGLSYGKLNKDKILKQYNSWLEASKKSGLTEEDLIKRSQKYLSIARELAPWWIEETNAMAEAIGVLPELFNAYQALRYLGTGFVADTQEECTTILAVGKATLTGDPILHKNRDGTQNPQSIYIKEMNYKNEKLYRFIGAGDVADIGVTNFLNEKGLAGAMNAGEPFPNPSSDGLPTPSILLLIAQKAANVDEAKDILFSILKTRGWYSNGYNGSIWFFADREKGLIVENTADKIAFQYVHDDFEVRANDYILLDRDAAVGKLGRERPGGLVRREAAIQRLKIKTGSLTPEYIIEVARDIGLTADTSNWTDDDYSGYYFPNICRKQTISGFTSVIRQDYTDILSYASIMNGHPNNVYSVPIYISSEGTLLPQVNGEVSEMSYQLTKSGLVGAHPLLKIRETEKGMYNKRVEMEKKVKTILDKKSGNLAEIIKIITNTQNEISQEAINLMRKAVGE